MNKKALRLLQYIINNSVEGEFVVLSKLEVKSALNDQIESLEELDGLIRYLELKKYIDIKLNDNNSVVVKPSLSGLVVAGSEKSDNVSGVISLKESNFRHFISGLVGGILGGIIVATVVAIIIIFRGRV
ncbi:MAG: hypothetical protein GX959_04345 [Clostridiales bacterium]|jgi:hypothetical protein|nr:hypothetical protein [Clostridiales bacterium]